MAGHKTYGNPWMPILFAAVLLVSVVGWAETGSASQIRRVILQSIYLDGEISEEVSIKEADRAEEIIAEYSDWSLVIKNEKELVFQRFINDISPLLKMNGYFGISEDGTLSIYNGKPMGSDIIHSFFQIDVDMLETKKHNELVEGIPVKNKKHYQEVLEVFKEYMD